MLLIAAGFSVSAQEVYTSSGKPPGVKQKEMQRKQKERERGFDINRLIVGGTLGFGMADNVIAFSVSPVVGYRITDKLAAGIGFGYQYFREKDALLLTDLHGKTTYFDFKASMISANVWARYLVLERLFVHAAYEHNFFSYSDYRYNQSGTGEIETYKVNLDVPSVLVGIGYRQPISGNASIYIMGLYDVLQRDFSPYKGGIQPSIGFMIGF